MKKFAVNMICLFIPVRRVRRNVHRRLMDNVSQQKQSVEQIFFIDDDENFHSLARHEFFDYERVSDKIEFYGGRNLIGKNVSIGKYSIVGVGSSIWENTKVGRYCSISKYVAIGAAAHPKDWLSTSRQFFKTCAENPGDRAVYQDAYKRTTIGNDVWVGWGAVVACGVNIGDGAIIGSGAVVTKDVPPYAIMGGVPAKVIGYRFDPETIARLLRSQWWNLPDDKLKDLPTDNIQECLRIFEEK